MLTWINGEIESIPVAWQQVNVFTSINPDKTVSSVVVGMEVSSDGAATHFDDISLSVGIDVGSNQDTITYITDADETDLLPASLQHRNLTGAQLHGNIAGSITITDAGDYFTSDNVEGALQELGAGGGGAGHDAVTLDANADTVLSLSTQEIGLDVQGANEVFAGPASGADAVPTFRALESDDIPDLSAVYDPAGTAAGAVSSHEGTYDHDDYNTAYGWGNHADAGYLTAITGESIGDLNDVNDTGKATGKILKYNAVSEKWEIADDNDTTYVSSDFDHDSLTNYVANEHIDWTVSQAPTVIHADNYTDTTYTAGDFNHDDLANIDGGVAGEYNHITDAELLVLQSTSGSNTGDQDLSGLIEKATFDAHTVLYATTDNTPAALEVTEQTVVGRLTGGNISAVAMGIGDNNVVQMDDADAADNDYAKFTAAGLEGRSSAEVMGDLSGQASAPFSFNSQNLTSVGTIACSSLTVADAGTIGSASDTDAMTISAGGVVGFTVFPETPTAAPTTNYQVANKKYVDDNISGGGASTALDNLASVAINTSLISDTDNTDDLGSSTKRWKDAYIAGNLSDGTNTATVANCKTAYGHVSLTSNPHSVTASQAGAVAKAASSTDNAIARWHETDGDELQNSGITISDTDVVSGITGLLPAADNTYNIGNSSGYYNNIYAHALRGNYGGSSNTVGCRGQFVPDADGTRYLGTSSLQWLQIYLSDRVNANGSSPMYAPNVANATSSVLAAQWHGDYLRRAASSSIRYKHDLTPFDVDINFDVNLLQMYNFKYKKEACVIEEAEIEKEQERRKSAKLEIKTDKEIKEELLTKESEVPQVGMIAENLAQIHPILAVYDKEGRVDAINDVLLPKYNLALIGKLITTVKTQQATIDSLTARIEKLENMIMPKDSRIK